MQTLDEQENLMRHFTGYEPVRNLEKATAFHLITVHIFWNLFKKYGNDDSLKPGNRSGDNSVQFTLDTQKTNGIEGCFICVFTSKGKSLSYRLEYYSSKDPDFSETSPCQYFPEFTFSAGYRSRSGVDWQGFAWLEEQIVPGRFEISINITGPKFESSVHLSMFKTAFFLTKILSEDILSLADWIESKRRMILFPDDSEND